MSFKKTCCFITFLAIAATVTQAQTIKARKPAPYFSNSFKALQTGFATIPDSVQTSVYWYWISGNISREGVIKDLEAMKKVGINRAFIGNIGLDNVPDGKVKMFSDDWWDILHTALKTATRLNIQIGIFNSPGWSQSGGPWVKPQQAMRYLTSSQIMVKGPVLLKQQLVKPKADFQDVKVIAYPVAADYAADISALKPQMVSIPAIDSLNNLFDDNEHTGIRLKEGAKFSVDVNAETAYTLRSVVINTTRQPVYLVGDVQAKTNGNYVTLKHFEIDRTNPELNTGFTPYGPATISVPATAATNFRIVFTRVSGNSGLTGLKFSAMPVVESYLEKTLAKMWPTPHPFWTAYQWPLQPNDANAYAIDPNKVQDISAAMAADGTLSWQVPAGNWIIERTGMAPTTVTNAPAPPEGRGLEVDKMSTEHVTAHFNAFMGEILKRIPAEDRKTWKVVVEDSYETGSQNWTDNLIAEFKQAYNYDPTPYLPVLQGKVVGNTDMADRFLWDLRRLIADDVSYKYVGGLREISHKNGLTTWLENYGHWGYPGEFLQYGGQSDEIGGEFWSEGDLGDIENRAASSSAHIYGKIKVSAESFTAAGAPFGRYPAMFKKRGDRFFTEGINNSLLHVYISQPADTLPGLTAWFGMEFNRLNTWFFDIDVLLQYLKRCNMMLQQGQYVADAAYFIGEDAPKMTGVTDPALPKGYSFDYINGEVIRQKLTVKNGRLNLPNGISYGILVLPKLETMRPELLAKIKELVQQGAVVLGPKPLRSPSLKGYPAADKQVQTMATKLWGKIDGVKIKVNHYGKGMVISGMDMQQALNMIKVIPDFKATGSDDVLFIHRQLKEGDLYFVSNQKDVPVKIGAAFRIKGKVPELWDATSGTMRSLPAYHQTGAITAVPLQLAPLESAFIIFRKPGKQGDTTRQNYPRPLHTIGINQPWLVSFNKNMRGPAMPVKFDTLTDWAKNTNDSIKYYSGTAYYRTTFDVGKIQTGSKYIIDLGLARSIAKVFVNGVESGGVWTLPYRVDITRAIKPGLNKLEIKVVNNWVNRLIGDALMPAGTRPTSVLFGPGAHDGLQQSGLLGPVKLDVIKY
ncbi:glycosyl hydrolase [Mucilaginibacter psychrotolerans]|uniref:Glycoside hydrolase family 2 n=1 Tax=Mucilaginibacter psychrotolerans TaxID=1524096 RepID=A0A4Y8SEM1_9SPHI|nr:glycosyl hydrolase [Mucilaginibacter psychrotolerans]TFF37080.1 glycoside hydrolase family 2 [Mucilaginibacter psychrotolerans]